MKLVDEAIKVLQNQDYSKKPVIAGVRIVPLKRFNDDGGSFTALIGANQRAKLPWILPRLISAKWNRGLLKPFIFMKTRPIYGMFHQ